MKLGSEVANLTIELKSRYARIIARNDPSAIRSSNEVIAALYALSCGSVVVALNAVGGKGWRKVMIDKKGVKALAVSVSGNSMLDKTLYNIEQFVAVTGAIREPRARAHMNRYLAEWHHVVDTAALKLHAIARHRDNRT